MMTARMLGIALNISAATVNRMLVDLGYLKGIPGNYSITEEGEKHGEEKDWWNGYGGSAMRGYSYVQWDDDVLEDLKED